MNGEAIAGAQGTSSSSGSYAGAYGSRFVVIYVVLGVVFVAAVTSAVVIAMKPGAPKSAPWSTWRPASGSAEKMQGDVSHVTHRYKLNASGNQLLVIVPSTVSINDVDGQNIAVSTVVIEQSSSNPTPVLVTPTTGFTQGMICGLSDACSVQGPLTGFRARLERREALEVALYTFKYVPSVKGMILYLPRAPKEPPSVLFFERSDFGPQLAQPLSRTLPRAIPPLPTDVDGDEAATIDRLTVPRTYTFRFTPITDTTAGLILVPAGT